MADKKISQLFNITGSDIANDDEFVVVDTSESETKAITASELRTAIGNGDFTVTGNLTVQGTTITVDSATAQNIVLGDNDKMTFGAGSDLQIYHDGSNSYVSDQGTGNIKILADDLVVKNAANTANMIAGLTGGAVTLYHDGDTRIATTSTGIDVTGTVTADGLTVDGNATLQGTGDVTLTLASDTDNSGEDDSPTIIMTQDGGSHYGHVGVNGQANTKFTGAVSNTPYIYSGVGFQVATNAKVSARPSITVGSTGDISFYEDTGTTAKFFWDASLEYLGIGTSSPSDKLTLNSGQMRLSDNYGIRWGSASTAIYGSAGAGTLQMYTNNSERMRIDSSGNVGIGTSSPQYKVNISNANASTGLTANPLLVLTNTQYTSGTGASLGFGFTSNSIGAAITGRSSASSAGGYLTFETRNNSGTMGERMRIDSSGNVGIGISSPSEKLIVDGNIFASTGNGQGFKLEGGNAIFRQDSGMAIHTNNSEAMRIDSSGNLLVGTTTTNISNSSSATGTVVNAGGWFEAAYTNIVSYLNRIGSDGDIVSFRKDGTTVGSIGANSDKLYIGSGDTGLRFVNTSNQIRPFNTSTGADRDAGFSLGSSAARFTDLYLSGGVYLGGTGAANKLDDYEEGSFTAYLNDTAGNTSSTSFTGSYVKVGQIVSVCVYLNNINVTGMQGTSSVSMTLPFTCNNSVSNANYWVGNAILDRVSLGSYVSVVPRTSGASSSLSFRLTGDNVNDGAFPWSYLDASNTSDIFLSITYQTA